MLPSASPSPTESQHLQDPNSALENQNGDLNFPCFAEVGPSAGSGYSTNDTECVALAPLSKVATKLTQASVVSSHQECAATNQEQNNQEKRQSPAIDNDQASAPKRFKRSLFLELVADAKEDRLENLEALGPDWVEFYNNLVTANELPSDDVYRIMALVSGIGCPQVILDIVDRRRSLSNASFDSVQSVSEIWKVYCLYNNIEGSIMCSCFQKCLIETIMYKRFKILHEQYQCIIKNNRKARYRKDYKPPLAILPNSNHRDASYYALNSLMAECLNLSIEEVEKGCYQAERKKVMRLKEQGRVLLEFGKLLEEKNEHVDIWHLFPMKRIRTPLDGNISVDVNRYVTFDVLLRSILTQDLDTLL